jgi:hypothetical protein
MNSVGISPRAGFDLACHPTTPLPAVRSLRVSPVLSADGVLRLDYHLAGDLPALRIPLAAAARAADGLWRHTCFEAFLLPQDGPGYVELNLSPSGEWAVYAFDAYRVRTDWQAEQGPAIEPSLAADALRLSARVRPDALPPSCRVPRLRLAVAAVVEAASGALSYWALRHPGAAPDFHHPASFVLDLDRAGDARLTTGHSP